MSILHQVWSWVSGLMSQMLSRRQPIYRPVCMVDVTSTASAAHQSPASQRRWASATQCSACLPACLRSSISTRTFSSKAYFALGFLLGLNAAEIPLRALMLVLLYKLHFKRAQTIIKIQRLGLKSELFQFLWSPNTFLSFFFFFPDTCRPQVCCTWRWTRVKRNEFVRFYKTRNVLPRSQERPR